MLPVFNQEEAAVFDNALQQRRDIFNCAAAEESAAREIRSLLAEQLTPAAQRLLDAYYQARTVARRKSYQQLHAGTQLQASQPQPSAFDAAAYAQQQRNLSRFAA